jgi:chemotaxis protein methyltransferase CheR
MAHPDPYEGARMINASDYDFFRRFLKTRSGLVLGDDKQYLLDSRLAPVIRRFGLASIGHLGARLREGAGTALEEAVVEAMTTNESFFFRDKTPFDMFAATMLPSLLRARPDARPIRIWCAAASTGQEPYSLAMLLSEQGSKLAGRRFEILATDLSSQVLEKAKAGIYTQFEVQRGLPVQFLVKYFTKTGGHWQISSDIRTRVEFRKLNLLQPFSGLGRFDIVFCRNVLIYFDNPTKLDVLLRISRCMAQDGFLVLGGAETVLGLTDALRLVPGQRGLYTISEPALAAAG